MHRLMQLQKLDGEHRQDLVTSLGEWEPWKGGRLIGQGRNEVINVNFCRIKIFLADGKYVAGGKLLKTPD